MIICWSQGLSRFLFCPAFCCRTDYLQAGAPNSDAHLFCSWVFRWLGSANCFSLWSLNGVAEDGGGRAGSSRGCPLCMSSADLRGLRPRRRSSWGSQATVGTAALALTCPLASLGHSVTSLFPRAPSSLGLPEPLSRQTRQKPRLSSGLHLRVRQHHFLATRRESARPDPGARTGVRLHLSAGRASSNQTKGKECGLSLGLPQPPSPAASCMECWPGAAGAPMTRGAPGQAIPQRHTEGGRRTTSDRRAPQPWPLRRRTGLSGHSGQARVGPPSLCGAALPGVLAGGDMPPGLGRSCA